MCEGEKWEGKKEQGLSAGGIHMGKSRDAQSSPCFLGLSSQGQIFWDPFEPCPAVASSCNVQFNPMPCMACIVGVDCLSFPDGEESEGERTEPCAP